MAMAATTTTPPSMTSAESEHVILAPASAVNPIPCLPAALRLDNQQQLERLLLQHPADGNNCNNRSTRISTSSVFRQVLVFGTESLRTLLLRQVLNDPHRQKQQNKKKNWDNYNQFNFPKSLQHNILSTRLLQLPSTSSTTTTTTTTIIGGEGAEVLILEEDSHEQVDVITYFLRPWDLSQTQAVHARIRAYKKRKVHHRIVYLPQPTALVSQLIQDLGLTAASNVSIEALQLDLFPIESDVLSLEYDHALRELTVEGTPSNLIQTCSRSLLKLQDIVGTIPRIQSIGKLGEEVLQKLLNQTVDEYLANDNETQELQQQTAKPLPDNPFALLLIDRNVDMVTPMVTPLTYEGLLDDVVGIDCGFIKVPVSTINPDDDDHSEKKSNPFANDEIAMLGVHAGDTLYAEVRDQHVEQFGSFLQNQAVALKESHANFTNKGTKKDLTEIHQFVKQIPVFTQNLRSLTNHIHLAELIKKTTEQIAFRHQWQTERSMMEGELCHDVIEEWIASGYPPYKLLRMLCLQSLTGGGLKSSRYDSFRAMVVQAYGYEFLALLHSLETSGWIRRKETLWASMETTGSSFAALRKSLILIHAEVDTVNPDDVSYVSSGYAPVSVRLVQSAMQGWNASKEEILKELPGRLLDIYQCHPPLDLTQTLQQQTPPKGESLGQYAKKQQHGNSSSKRKPTLFVFFLGGITFMEIAALRFLSKRSTFPYHIVMITTKVISGDSLLQSLA